MDKYKNFINEIKEEANNKTIVDLTQQIKSNYQPKDSSVAPKRKLSIRQLFAGMTLTMTACAVCIVIIIFNMSTPAIVPPTITTTVSETYAFEIMSAANMIYSNQQTKSVNTSKRTISSEELTIIAEEIHQHYLTMQQLLYKEKIDYQIEASNFENYTEQMRISLSLNDDMMVEYIVYYNKTFKELDDDEETYDLEGIIIIDNQRFAITGETEIEEDETSTTIKVMISEGNYFIVEQEFEADEQEFVYAEYVDNKLVNEYSLSYEIEDNETKLALEYRQGKNTGQIEAKLVNNKIYFEVELTSYNGEVIATIASDGIKYYFEEEKIEIFVNFTNKNTISFVY